MNAAPHDGSIEGVRHWILVGGDIWYIAQRLGSVCDPTGAMPQAELLETIWVYVNWDVVVDNDDVWLTIQHLRDLSDDMRLVLVKYADSAEEARRIVHALITRGDMKAYDKVVITMANSLHAKSELMGRKNKCYASEARRHELKRIEIEYVLRDGVLQECGNWMCRPSDRLQACYYQFFGSMDQYIAYEHVNDVRHYYSHRYYIVTFSDKCTCCFDDAMEMSLVESILPQVYRHYAGSYVALCSGIRSIVDRESSNLSSSRAAVASPARGGHLRTDGADGKPPHRRVRFDL